eukprot:TRINITY_DN29812_c0_g1_i1.p1 TRINITY_DN29812_c0_g1~~TRINITY_DN29812_c0_g1_i1.p1  ORF type:complete len:458 (+),score=85.59 TRINITY_DN29812_c0_g1_i1:43-1374(+)
MWSVFLLALKATTRVVLICAAGAYLQGAGIVNNSVRKSISKVVVQLLLPCLLFTRIVRTMNLENGAMFLWLCFANLLYVSLGMLIGRISTLLTKPPAGVDAIFAVAPAVGHGNAIPLLLAPHICALHGGFDADAALRAEGYVGLYLVMHTITMWGIGFNIIKKQADKKKPSEEQAESASRAQAEIIGSQQVQTASLAANGSTANECDVVLTEKDQSTSDPDDKSRERAASDAWAESMASVEAGAQPQEPSPASPPRFSLALQGARSGLARLQRMVPDWVNRPMLAALTATLLACIAPLKSFIVDPDSLFAVPFSTMDRIGTAAPVMALLGVGSTFIADGWPTIGIVGWKPLLSISFARLVILPLCAMGFWYSCRLILPFFPTDSVFMVVVCVESCMPCAYNIVTMCTLQGCGEREMSATLYYMSLLAIFTITAWVVVFLSVMI